MRGPHDDQIPSPDKGSERKAVRGGTPAPKNKPLLRLLDLLDARGMGEIASLVAPTAAVNDSRALLPSRPAPRRSAAPKGGRRARGARGAEAPQGALAVSARAAQEHIDAAGMSGPPTGPPTGSGPQWRSLGPYTIPNGQTYGSLRVNVSGRVAAIAVDPSRPAHVLCGAANGGVWESFDRGASWAPRTDYQATTAVGAIVFDPTTPLTVYCGTGEGNWWSWLGVGILRSTDGGTTWSTLCTAPFVGQGFYDLRVDPANRLHLVAATTGGLYVSTDGGVTWTRRRTSTTWAVAFGTGEILCASGDGIFRSTDGGTTWTAVSLPGSPGGFNRIAVAIAPSNPTVAYAWGANGATAYLWRRASGTWTAASSLPAGLSTGQAWYDWYCAAAPDRDNEVYLGAIEAYRGDLSGTTWTWTVTSNHAGGADPSGPARRRLRARQPEHDLLRLRRRSLPQPGSRQYLGPLQQRPGDHRVRVHRPERRRVALADRRHAGQRHRTLDGRGGLGSLRGW